jgi:preprotein translocase subunit YajC
MELIIIFIVIMGGMMFWSSRTQKKRVEADRVAKSEIKKGDYVISIGGIVGTVENTKGDVFNLKTENGGKISVAKQGINKKLSAEEWSGLHDSYKEDSVKDTKKEQKKIVKTEKTDSKTTKKVSAKQTSSKKASASKKTDKT